MRSFSSRLKCPPPTNARSVVLQGQHLDPQLRGPAWRPGRRGDATLVDVVLLHPCLRAAWSCFASGPRAYTSVTSRGALWESAGRIRGASRVGWPGSAFSVARLQPLLRGGTGRAASADSVGDLRRGVRPGGDGVLSGPLVELPMSFCDRDSDSLTSESLSQTVRVH